MNPATTWLSLKLAFSAIFTQLAIRAQAKAIRKKFSRNLFAICFSRVNDIFRAHTIPTATPASQFMWFKLPRIWEMFVVPF